jgi:hypothetical protein
MAPKPKPNSSDRENPSQRSTVSISDEPPVVINPDEGAATQEDHRQYPELTNQSLMDAAKKLDDSSTTDRNGSSIYDSTSGGGSVFGSSGSDRHYLSR